MRLRHLGRRRQHRLAHGDLGRFRARECLGLHLRPDPGEFQCEYRGKVGAKGKGEIDMYFVAGAIT